MLNVYLLSVLFSNVMLSIGDRAASLQQSVCLLADPAYTLEHGTSTAYLF